MSLFSNPKNDTAKRKTYMERTVEHLCERVAEQLMEGTTTREIGLRAVEQMVAAMTPNSGKGHADYISNYIQDRVESIITERESQEVKESDAA